MRMHRRENADNIRVMAFSAKVIKLLLNIANCSNHYRVEILIGELIVRESTQDPPIPRRKERFEKLVRILEDKGVFKFVDKELLTRVDGQEKIIPCKSVIQINVNKLFEFLQMDFSDKPANIEESTWAAIPKAVKSRWRRFSSDMQVYIAECCKSNAEDRVFDLLQTRLITDSKRSPITFDVPKIPVRLPNPDLDGGASNEVYDLIEVLNIQQRDPEHFERRADPITRRFFDLSEVIPAKEARESILQQGLPGGPK